MEIETLCGSRITQIVGCIGDDAPLYHITELSRFDAAHQFIGTIEEVWLSYNHILQVLAVDALGFHQLLQREVRITSLELLQGHLIIVGLRVAEFCARPADLGQFRLDFHHVLHLLGCCTLTEAEKLEHLDNVRLKGLTDSRRCLIVIQIVFLLSERETTLIDVQDILRSVLVVSTKTRIEELLRAIRRQLQQDVLQLLVALGSFQALDKRHHWVHTFLITTVDIHRQFVEVTQFLLCGSLLIGVLLQFREDRVDTLVIVLLQLVETTIA